MRHHTAHFCSTAVAVLLLVTALFLPAYGAGDNRAGTNAAPELLIPVGARDIAVGGSMIATTSGIEAIFWNPAGMARTKFNSDAMFSYMNYIADIGVDFFAISATFEGFGSLGLSMKSVSIGDIKVTTEDQPDGTGQTFRPTIFNLGLTYSRLLTDRISVGATVSLLSERFDRVSATGFAFDAGVQYVGLAGLSGLSIGVAVKNIGPQMKFDGDGLLRQGNIDDVLRPGSFYKVQAASFELPSTIELGVSYAYTPAELNVLNFHGVFQNNNFAGDEYKLGVEYGYNNTFFVRAGYNISENMKDNTSPLPDNASYIFGFTAGAGVHYPVGALDLTFDYAFRSVKFLEDNHIFSLKVGL